MVWLDGQLRDALQMDATGGFLQKNGGTPKSATSFLTMLSIETHGTHGALWVPLPNKCHQDCEAQLDRLHVIVRNGLTTVQKNLKNNAEAMGKQG